MYNKHRYISIRTLDSLRLGLLRFAFGGPLLLLLLQLALFQSLDLHVFHVGHKGAPQHAEEADEDHLVAGGHEGKVDRLHARPIDDAHLVRVPELLLDLQPNY